MAVKVKFKNAHGESIDMGTDSSYILEKYSGFSSNDVDTLLGSGFGQQGSYYYGSNEKARVLNMTCKYRFSTTLEGKQIRKDLARIFNPNLGLGQITYEDDTGKYIIGAVVSVKPDIYFTKTEGIYTVNAFDVVLTCPKPDWLSFESYQVKMVDFVGGLKLPFTLPFTLASRGAGGRIEYKGDNPADCMLDFRMKEGGLAVVNPRIENQMGEYIELQVTIEEGERLLIDTDPDAPSITFIDAEGNKEDGWDYKVQGSTFFQLYTDKYDDEKGLNVFSFTADSGNPEVYLTYREHYAGI